jgi:hypothetical protein
LRKLLQQQRDANDLLGAGRTCELLSSFSGDAITRARELAEAAEAFQAAGDPLRARGAINRAVEANPLDEDALWTASGMDLAENDHEATASRLGRLLQNLPPPDAHHAPRRAELWRRLGDARKTRGDVRNAILAYDKAIASDPESDAGLTARRTILALDAAVRPTPDVLLGHLRGLVVAEQKPAEVLALAHALSHDAGAGPVDEDGGRATLELAAALGEQLTDDDQAYLVKHPARVMAPDEIYAGVIEDADHAALFADPDDAPLGEILLAMWEAAPILWPDAARAVETAQELGIVAAERVGPREESAATSIYAQITKVLGTPATVLYAARAAEAPDVTVICASPPAIVLGPGVLDTRAATSSAVVPTRDAELRFLLGRAALLARPARACAAGLTPRRFAHHVAALARAFGQVSVRAEGLDATAVEQEAEKLRKDVPFKIRLRVEELLKKVTAPLDPLRYRAACQRAADRAGLLVCGNVTVALRLAGADVAGLGKAKPKHLIVLAVTERYLAARAKIGIGASR